MPSLERAELGSESRDRLIRQGDHAVIWSVRLLKNPAEIRSGEACSFGVDRGCDEVSPLLDLPEYFARLSLVFLQQVTPVPTRDLVGQFVEPCIEAETKREPFDGTERACHASAP